jgi:hypothetical protein
MNNVKLLERTYFSFLFVIFFLVIFTPYIIKSGFMLVEEETLEVIIIVFLFGIGYVILKLYRREVENNLKELERIKRERHALESRLTEAFKYIGSINVQIKEIKSAFSDIKKFPESKKDLKYILQFSADKILSIINTDWAIVRIVDINNSKTLREYCRARGEAVLIKYKIDNDDLLKNKKLNGYKVITSSQENFYIKTFCVIPAQNISRDQEDLAKAIITQLEMLFVIFSSNYYKNTRINGNIK